MYELRKVKIARQLSEETTAFTAELLLDGKLVGHCSNRGHGDPVLIHYVSREAEAAHVAYCAAQPPLPSKYFPDGLKYSTDIHVDELLAEYDLTKTLTRACKTKLLFRLKGQEPGAYYETKLHGSQVEQVATLTRQRHGEKLDLIFNDNIPAAVAAVRKGQS